MATTSPTANAIEDPPGADPLAGVGRLLILDTLSYRPHLETSVEIALTARERGAVVRYRNLRAALPRSEDQSWASPRSFDVNALRVRRALRLLRDAGCDAAVARDADGMRRRAALAARALLQPCTDIEAVRGLGVPGFEDAGWAALASTIQVTRNPQIAIRTGGLLEAFLETALFTFEAATRAIAEFRPDAVLLFNGRFASTRPIFRAARQAAVRTLIHERGCDKNHYWIATASIHDPDHMQSCIRSFWRPELAEAGAAFFRDRRQGVERAWYSFTRSQQQGRIPDAMRTGRRRWVVFFTTSEDEYVSIGPKYINREFPTQLDAIRAVAAAAHNSDAALCVRVHPHVARKHRAQIEFWRRFKLPGAVIVQPDDPVDSYALLDAAHVVATCGSTMGVEAAFWGKPSLLLGRSIYDGLGVAQRAYSVAEIERFLGEPRALGREGALMYGAFFGRFGTPFRHFRADDLFASTIGGRRLDDAWPVTLWRRLRGRYQSRTGR